MMRTPSAAPSKRVGVATFGAGMMLVIALVGCGAENTGSLELFAPAKQSVGSNAQAGDAQAPAPNPVERDARPIGSNEAEDARPPGAGGQANVPPAPGCPDGGCVPATCRGDVDCNSGSASRCEVGSGRCVECMSTPDCTSGDRPLCDTASHSCVECVLDSDCRDPSKPGCFKPTGRCEECSNDAQCGNGLTCDMTDGHCR